MEQDTRHRLALLLEVEWFIPVAPALVVSVSRPVEHCEHDGDIQGVVILVLYVPHEYCHWETGVLRGGRYEVRSLSHHNVLHIKKIFVCLVV